MAAQNDIHYRQGVTARTMHCINPTGIRERGIRRDLNEAWAMWEPSAQACECHSARRVRLYILQ